MRRTHIDKYELHIRISLTPGEMLRADAEQRRVWSIPGERPGGGEGHSGYLVKMFEILVNTAEPPLKSRQKWERCGFF